MLMDWRGTPIAVGSSVVYPTRQRSRMWMTEGVVEEIVGQVVKVRRNRASDSRSSHSQNEKMVYPAVERVTVI